MKTTLSLELLEQISERTETKFEMSEGAIIPKEGETPISHEWIASILQGHFDLAQFQQTLSVDIPSYNHTKIIRQLDGLLWRELDQSLYAHYVESVKISHKTGFFRIPDLVISLQSEERLSEQSVLENPFSIIEVLSPSTENKDRNEKMNEYKSLPGLQEYVLIAQDRFKIEQYLRKGKTDWIVKIYDSADQCCVLTVGVRIKLNELYQKTDWFGKN